MSVSNGAERPAIELVDVGVRFRIPNEPIRSFKEYILRRLRGRLGYRELWAVEQLDLSIQPGEFFGVVGNNGAGKSTLLKVICRIIRPTSGRVVVRGRVAPLLELNAGFHPDLTGLENVFLNAGLLGYRRSDIEPHFDEIVAFAELEEFIHLPIRNYSSGMVARLGFSVASIFRPEVLVLDEFLAVGDPGFQEKSLERIEGFCEAGTTVLLVSHSLEQVEHHCTRLAWLEHGRVQSLGGTESVLDDYRRFLSEPTTAPSPTAD